MTKVSIMVPILELNAETNNPEIIKRVLKDKYPYLSIHQIYWVQSNQSSSSNQTVLECVVRVQNIGINFDQLVQTFQQKQSLQNSMAKLKSDIFSMVQNLKILQFSRDTAKNSRIKQDNNIVQDISLSMKLQQKQRYLKKSSVEDQELYSKQLLNAISDLTKENIKLKDSLQYYKIQFEAFLKPNAQLKLK